MIPDTGPPGTNGRIDVIPPAIAPLAIPGRYFSILLAKSLLIILPLRRPSSSYSPNNQFLTPSDLIAKSVPAPIAAPNKGPPTAPVTRDTPAPIKPLPIKLGK